MKHLVTIAACCALVATVAAAAADGGMLLMGVPVAYACAALAMLIQWVAFVPSFVARTEHYYDLVGSFTYLSVTWMALLATARFDVRALVLVGLITVWCVRLGSFLFRRVKRRGKDGRFDEIKQSAGRFLVTWTLQGVWVFMTASAALAAITVAAPRALGIVDAIGMTIWLIGFALEVIADRQKSAFREANEDGFIQTGLWAWSRHPNYFGEIMLWTGIAIIAGATVSGWQWVTMVSPVFVTVLLMFVSGVPMLEKRADKRWGDRQDYLAYKARTPVLLPKPPRSS